MAWCPKCKYEYRQGFKVCSDCGEKLTNEVPEKNTLNYSTTIIYISNLVLLAYQTAILVIIPTLLVLSVCIYTSPEMQRALIPNPAFSIRDELPSFTANLALYNYIFLFLFFVLVKKLPLLIKPRSKWIRRILFVYTFANTLVFAYFFYIFYIYNPFDRTMWHLFEYY